MEFAQGRASARQSSWVEIGSGEKAIRTTASTRMWLLGTLNLSYIHESLGLPRKLYAHSAAWAASYCHSNGFTNRIHHAMQKMRHFVVIRQQSSRHRTVFFVQTHLLCFLTCASRKAVWLRKTMLSFQWLNVSAIVEQQSSTS